MPEKPKEPPRPSPGDPDRRAERLAAALKANLVRRKAQQRRRAGGAAGADKSGTDDRNR
jgi:hypothetical protein